MTIQVGIERIDGLDEVRARFGDSSQINRRIDEVLNRAAHVGVESARVHAPKDQGLLAKAISEDSVRFAAQQEFIEASFGVNPVSRATRGAGGRFTGSTSGARNYPLWVHEGTGLYGRLHRLITPRRARYMRFVGHTGLVFARTTKGQRPQPYMLEGFEDASRYIEAHLDAMVGRLIE